MQYTIKGQLAQVAALDMSAGETCWASKGSLMSLTPGVDWSLKIPGGVGGAVRRSLSGEGISLTYIRAKQDSQQVSGTQFQSTGQDRRLEPGRWTGADHPWLFCSCLWNRY